MSEEVKQKLIDGELSRISEHIFKYQDMDLKSLSEGELKEAIAEAANATGEAIEGTVAGSGLGLNPSTGPTFGPGQNDPNAGTCLGCKNIDPEGEDQSFSVIFKINA